MAKYDPDEFFDRKKQTNGDRIRQLTDFQLGVLLSGAYRVKPITSEAIRAANAWEAWLQQEVDK